MAIRVLIVLTSHDTLGDTGNATGYWKEEFATPYYALLDAGAEITLATPKGGPAPVDPNSETEQWATESTRRLDDDEAAQKALRTTRRLADVEAASFDAVFYPGGHGPLWDIHTDTDSIRLIEDFHGRGKPVATVCHSSVALANAKAPDGAPIVEGRKVTGFTNAEEDAIGLTDVVPVLVQDALAAAGGRFDEAEAFAPNVVQDGLLITGQNPVSSRLVAERLISALKAAR